MKELTYFLLGVYALTISWHYNHSLWLVLLHWIIWPAYLIYELLTGNLAHGAWKDIPLSYFN